MNFLTFLSDNRRWLGAGAVMTLLSSFGQTFFISIFAGGIRADYGLSHGEWGGIYAAGTMASAVVMVWAGALSDVLRVRSLGALSLLLLALSCLAMMWNQSATLLIVVVFGLRFSGQGMLSHVARVGMVRWFVAARGKALAVATVGFAIGEALFPLLIVSLLPVIAWRHFWGAAALISLLIIPLLFHLLKVERTPASIAKDHSADGLGGRHWRRGDMIGHPLFWMCLPALMGPAAFGTALFFHQVHLAEVKGWQHIDFVSLIPIYTGVAVVSMFVAGWAVDRFGSWRLFALFQLPFAAGMALLGLSDSLWIAAASFALFGIMQGANSTGPASFLAEIYGTRHLGAIKALSTGAMVLGSAIGPGLTGAVIDLGMDFNDQLIWIAAYIVAAAACAGLGIWRARGDMVPV